MGDIKWGKSAYAEKLDAYLKMEGAAKTKGDFTEELRELLKELFEKGGIELVIKFAAYLEGDADKVTEVAIQSVRQELAVLWHNRGYTIQHICDKLGLTMHKLRILIGEYLVVLSESTVAADRGKLGSAIRLSKDVIDAEKRITVAKTSKAAEMASEGGIEPVKMEMAQWGWIDWDTVEEVDNFIQTQNEILSQLGKPPLYADECKYEKMVDERGVFHRLWIKDDDILNYKEA